MLAFVAGLFLTFNAAAQRLDGDRNTVAQDLLSRYGEKTVSLALSAGGVVELFATPGGETWTLILTMPDGRVFFVGNGTDWSTMPLKKGTAL